MKKSIANVGLARALSLLLLLTMASLSLPSPALDTREVAIMSEGVKLAATVYTPEGESSKRWPAIIMSHGWGGTAAMLRGIAEDFAKAGYLVIAFDYRGWGRSAGRLIAADAHASNAPAGGQKFETPVVELREVVDPVEQATDILNVIHWAYGEARVDRDRIGLWGTSFSGGLVVHAAARDLRVKALVSQVGYMGGISQGAGGPQNMTRAYDRGAQRARGEVGYPPPGTREVGNLYGAPIWEKFLQFNAADDAARAAHSAMLFIVAEKEELFDNRDHAQLAHSRHLGTKKYVVIPEITHYGIYSSARAQATRLAIEWFDQNLK